MYKTVHLDTLTLTGASGTQLSTLRVNGTIAAVYLKFVGQTAPVFSLTTQGTLGPGSQTIIGLTGNTNGWYYPRAKTVDNTNTAITNSNDKFVVDDFMIVGVSSAGAVGTVDVWLIIEDGVSKIG